MNSTQVHDIALILSKEETLVQNWHMLFYALGLRDAVLLRTGRQNGTISSYDLFRQILNCWLSESGRNATVDHLCSKLTELDYINVCEKLQAKYRLHLEGSNIFFGFPQSTKNFIGRTDQLQQLSQKLQELNREEPTIIKIVGLGGMGKSELSKRFATLHKKEINAIWLNGESPETLQASLLLLAEEVGIFNPDLRNTESHKLFSLIFKGSKLNSSRLVIIIDNIDVINEDVVPVVQAAQNFNSFCIVTSRQVGVLDFAGTDINLDVLEDEDARKLVRESTEDEKETDITELCRRLQNFPLALQQALDFIKRERRVSLKGKAYHIPQYLDNYEIQKVKVLDFKLNCLEHYKLTTFITWNTSIEAIGSAGAAGVLAVKLLEMMAYFEADRIPFDFINRLNLAETTETNVEGSVEILKSYSLIKVEDEIISIHRLVQEVMRIKSQSSNTQISHLTQLIKAINEIVLNTAEMPHVLSVWTHVANHPQLCTPEFNIFRINIIHRLRDLCLYREMVSFATSSHEMVKELFGEDHRDTLRLGTLVADGLFYNGKYVEAQKRYEVLSSIQESILGNEDEITLGTDYMMAQNLVELKRYEDAQTLTLALLERRKKVSGELSEETIQTKELMARVLTKLGKYVEGEEMYKQVLEWQKSQLGEKHPETLVTIHNLGHNLYSQDKYGEAKSIFQQLLQVGVRVRGENHSETLATKSWLAWTLHRLGESSEALEMFQQVLLSREKVLGAQHPYTLLTKERIQAISSKISSVPNEPN